MTTASIGNPTGRYTGKKTPLKFYGLSGECNWVWVQHKPRLMAADTAALLSECDQIDLG